MDVTQLGRDEVLMARHMHKDVSAIYAQGRIQCEAKRSRGGVPPFFKKILRQTGRLQQQTEFIAMIYKHVLWSGVVYGSIL